MAEINAEEEDYANHPLPKFYKFPSVDARERILYANFERVNQDVKDMIFFFANIYTGMLYLFSYEIPVWMLILPSAFRFRTRLCHVMPHQLVCQSIFHRFQAFPLNVYPIPSTAVRMVSSVAGPLMVRVLAEALALAFSTPGTSSTARTTAASQWLQCMSSTR